MNKTNKTQNTSGYPTKQHTNVVFLSSHSFCYILLHFSGVEQSTSYVDVCTKGAFCLLPCGTTQEGARTTDCDGENSTGG